MLRPVTGGLGAAAFVALCLSACDTAEDAAVVRNHPPIVSVTVAPASTTNTTGSIVLDASASHDPDGDAITFEWTSDAADAFTGTDSASDTISAPTVSFHYAIPGTYSVNLTVSDDKGGASDYVTQVTITNAPPYLTGPTELLFVEGGQLVSTGFSVTDPEGQHVSVYWRQTLGPEVNIQNPYALDLSFVTPVGEVSMLYFEAAYSDGIVPVTETVRVFLYEEGTEPGTFAYLVDTCTGQCSVPLVEGYGLYGAGTPDDPYNYVRVSGQAVYVATGEGGVVTTGNFASEPPSAYTGRVIMYGGFDDNTWVRDPYHAPSTLRGTNSQQTSLYLGSNASGSIVDGFTILPPSGFDVTAVHVDAPVRLTRNRIEGRIEVNDSAPIIRRNVISGGGNLITYRLDGASPVPVFDTNFVRLTGSATTPGTEPVTAPTEVALMVICEGAADNDNLCGAKVKVQFNTFFVDAGAEQSGNAAPTAIFDPGAGFIEASNNVLGIVGAGVEDYDFFSPPRWFVYSSAPTSETAPVTLNGDVLLSGQSDFGWLTSPAYLSAFGAQQPTAVTALDAYPTVDQLDWTYLFVNYEAADPFFRVGDYAPNPGGLLYDAGASVSPLPEDDFFGLPRLVGDAPDVGAVEFPYKAE